MFTVSNGVRQGGILSPLFFNVYLDGLSDILCRTECGCTMGGRMINHIMYADDLVIVSPSAKGLQRLVDICAAYGDIHHAKTMCMYLPSIGKCTLNSPHISLNLQKLSFLPKFKYLCSSMTQDNSDHENMRRQRGNCYARSNGIIKNFYSCSPAVKCDIFKAFCCNMYCVFVDLEKAYDKVPRDEVWYCMRKSGLAEKYVRIVQDMYDDSITAVRCAVGVTEGFEVKVGLYQGSALSPCLFAMVMDRITDDIREEAPWTMMFADDIVICSESKERLEQKLESWRYALERRGMKVNRRKTEYMCVNERQVKGTVKMQGEEVAKVEDFKYLGSTVQSNGECGREVKKRVQAGWNGWRRMSGVICDRRVSARVKGKVYRVAVRPAMLYGLETVALTKRQEAEMEVAELKMLRFSLGVTRMDKIRNEYIRGTAQVGRFGEKTREARLRWYGHVLRKDDGYIGRRMLRMELPGKRKRGRPKRRFMDVVKEGMAEVEVKEEDADNRSNWRLKIRCGDP